MVVPRPAQLPLLKAIAWQRANLDQLTPEQTLCLYERNWRMRGVLAELTGEELDYVRALATEFSSDLLRDL